MYNFRMLNRRPLELPALDTLVPMVTVEYRPFTASQARGKLKQMPNLLYNKYSGWHFFLSNEGIRKMTNEHYVHGNTMSSIHLSAVANIEALVWGAVLGYSKPEPPSRINSAGRKVHQNIDIKANHRFYVGAWIEGKPYSVRMMIREYYDGRVELCEEAKAYALNIKEMRGIVTGQSESPASPGLTTAIGHAPLIKGNISGISAPSPRCGQAPPTDIPLTGTKIQNLIESNLTKSEILFYQQRTDFDYSKTGTDCMERIFDRLRLTPEQRASLYNGDKIVVSGVRLHNPKTDIILYLEHGELIYRPYKPFY